MHWIPFLLFLSVLAPTQPTTWALIDTAAASRRGLLVLRPSNAFAAEWFARRYGIELPIVNTQRLGSPAGEVDVHSLKPRPEDATKLWAGLAADLAPNQALVERRGIIGLVISSQPELRRQTVAMIRPTRHAPSPTDLDWLATEMPREIPGIYYAYARFLDPLPELEARTGGIELRAVYQASYNLAPGGGAPKGLAQADFWVPRGKGQLSDLVRALDTTKTGEQTIMSGKGVAVQVSTRTDQATGILVKFLEQKGYKLESRVVTFPPPSPR